MPDINALWEQAKSMSIPQLQAAIAGQFPTMPASVAAPALMAKAQLEQAAKLQQGANAPKSTVISDLEKQLSGVGALPPGTLGQQLPQRPIDLGTGQPVVGNPYGIASTNSQATAGGAPTNYPYSAEDIWGNVGAAGAGTGSRPTRYAGGGIVSLADGDLVPDPAIAAQADPAFMRRYLQQQVGRPTYATEPSWLNKLATGIGSAFGSGFNQSYTPLTPSAPPAPALAQSPSGEGWSGAAGTSDPIAALATAGPGTLGPPPTYPPLSPPPPRSFRGSSSFGSGPMVSIEDQMKNAITASKDLYATMNPDAANNLDVLRADAAMPPEELDKQRTARLAAKGITGLAGQDQLADLQQMKADLASRQGDRFGQALMQAGFATMAGRSPYALTNIGEGAGAGLKNYLDSQKLDVADKEKLLQVGVTIDNQRRAEAIGDVDAVDKEVQHRQALLANASESAQKVGAQLVDTYMKTQGTMYDWQMRAKEMADWRQSATAERGFQATQQHEYLEQQLKQNQELRQDAMTQAAVESARKEMTGVLSDPMKASSPLGMKFSAMSDDEKENYVQQRAANNVRIQMQLQAARRAAAAAGPGGIPTMPTQPQSMRRGGVDAAGNLIP